MKQTDDVFFFVLVDFLVQAFFFGLVLFAVSSAKQKRIARSALEHKGQESVLLARAGVSSIVELTDLLSRLAPVTELPGMAEFMTRAGGPREVQAKVALIEQVGGVDSLLTRMERLRRIEEGSGLPPCLYSERRGKKVSLPLATVIATDSIIVFESETQELTDVLRQMNLSYGSINTLSLKQFELRFTALKSIRPDCRYTLRFVERTPFVYARDAAQSAFYLRIVRQ